MGEYSKLIYDFVWGDFCDWYVEFLKAETQGNSIESNQKQINFGISLFENILCMVHPIMPFVTEELWQNIYNRNDNESICIAEFPKYKKENIDLNIEKEFNILQLLIESIRRMRSGANASPSKKIDVSIKSSDFELITFIKSSEKLLKLLGKIENLIISDQIEKPNLSASEVIYGCEVFVHLEGLIDLDKEKEKIIKEISRLEGQIKGVESKLNNEKFMSGAPENVVESEKNKLANFSDAIIKLNESLKAMN